LPEKIGTLATKDCCTSAYSAALLASMSSEGMGPSLAVEGATTKAIFEAYAERVLAPSLSPGQIVVMDNFSAHKGERVRQLIEGRGCELLYLPPSEAPPDLNPIEEAFSKLKASLRRAGARTREALCWKRRAEPSTR